MNVLGYIPSSYKLWSCCPTGIPSDESGIGTPVARHGKRKNGESKNSQPLPGELLETFFFFLVLQIVAPWQKRQRAMKRLTIFLFFFCLFCFTSLVDTRKERENATIFYFIRKPLTMVYKRLWRIGERGKRDLRQVEEAKERNKTRAKGDSVKL